MSERLLQTLVDEVKGLRQQLTAQARYDKPLTRDEAAAYLNVNPSTLYKWARANRIGYTRFSDEGGSGMRFLKTDLDSFLAKHHVSPLD